MELSRTCPGLSDSSSVYLYSNKNNFYFKNFKTLEKIQLLNTEIALPYDDEGTVKKKIGFLISLMLNYTCISLCN